MRERAGCVEGMEPRSSLSCFLSPDMEVCEKAKGGIHGRKWTFPPIDKRKGEDFAGLYLFFVFIVS